MSKETLGGKRVGTGAGIEVEIPEYGRANHNLNKTWRSNISMGTIVPVMALLGVRGDTFDIDTAADIQTPGAIGALFGSAKFQVDYYVAPWRLYMGLMHNNALGVGNRMGEVKIPQMWLEASNVLDFKKDDYNTKQISQSSIFAYMGTRGVGRPKPGTNQGIQRQFNALKILAYYDICKNYYWNKQEGIGGIIHNKVGADENVREVTAVDRTGSQTIGKDSTAPQVELKRDTITIFKFSINE